jgi:Zn-dependent M28 family amino/carboxypeptidase
VLQQHLSLLISPKFNDAIISSSTIDGNYEADYTLNLKTNTKQISSENVLGFLEGTDKKDEVLVITGHYDHIGYDNGEICNGADDDGSGTVSVLEIAEAFAKAAKEGKRPRRSILFMTVSGEEKGLLGSQYYVDNPIYPLENTIANLNIDMVGRVDDAHKNNPTMCTLLVQIN